jgi:siroheme synthase-like protein
LLAVSGSTALTVFPVGLVVAGRPCLVVGGGRIAARKAEALAGAGAVVHVIAPEVGAEVGECASVVRRRAFQPGDCVGYRYVVAATGDAVVDTAVAADAERAGAWVNAVDRPGLCSAVVPAVLHRGPITVSVTTGGASPAFASWLRDRIAEVVTEQHAEVVGILAAERAALRTEGCSTIGHDWATRIEDLLADTASTPTGDPGFTATAPTADPGAATATADSPDDTTVPSVLSPNHVNALDASLAERAILEGAPV